MGKRTTSVDCFVSWQSSLPLYITLFCCLFLPEVLILLMSVYFEVKLSDLYLWQWRLVDVFSTQNISYVINNDLFLCLLVANSIWHTPTGINEDKCFVLKTLFTWKHGFSLVFIVVAVTLVSPYCLYVILIWNLKWAIFVNIFLRMK